MYGAIIVIPGSTGIFFFSLQRTLDDRGYRSERKCEDRFDLTFTHQQSLYFRPPEWYICYQDRPPLCVLVTNLLNAS